MKEDDTHDDDEGLTTYPYDCLKTSSTNPAPDIDITRREVRLRFLFFSFRLSSSDSESFRADLLVCGRVQGEIRDDEERLLQVAEMETE